MVSLNLFTNCLVYSLAVCVKSSLELMYIVQIFFLFRQQVRAFANFEARLGLLQQYSSITHRNPARLALLLDRSIFTQTESSWFINYCFIIREFFTPENAVQLDPLKDLDLAANTILVKCRSNRVTTIESSPGFSFLLRWFEEGVSSPNFRRRMGELDYEIARLFVLFMGNQWRWCIFPRPRRGCPGCDESLYSEHFFGCPDTPNRPANLVSWEEFLALGRRGEWLECAGILVRVLRWWDSSHGLRSEVKGHLDDWC